MIKVRAWGVSILAHALVLSLFGVVKFSHQNVINTQVQAAVSINPARQSVQSQAVIPKPKVVSEAGSVSKTTERKLPDSKKQITNIKSDLSQCLAKIGQIPNSNYQTIPLNNPQKVQAELPTTNETRTAQAEFFGSVSQGRRICYVVDCSGSMQGLWQRVQEELIESIGLLQPDQYFCVIAFGAGNVLESGDGKMLRASERAKKEACSFVDSLKPGGVTNAQNAIQKAAKIRDDTNIGPEVIYFLTDGFELSEQDNFRFAHQVMTIIRSFSPKTQINTIGFWPSEQDRRTLELIAKESGGAFVIVPDGYLSTSTRGVDDE